VRNKIDVIAGFARFIDARTIEVAAVRARLADTGQITVLHIGADATTVAVGDGAARALRPLCARGVADPGAGRAPDRARIFPAIAARPAGVRDRHRTGGR